MPSFDRMPSAEGAGVPRKDLKPVGRRTFGIPGVVRKMILGLAAMGGVAAQETSKNTPPTDQTDARRNRVHLEQLRLGVEIQLPEKLFDTFPRVISADIWENEGIKSATKDLGSAYKVVRICLDNLRGAEESK